VRANFVKNFPIDAPVEIHPANVCEEQFDWFHRLAVRAVFTSCKHGSIPPTYGGLLVSILAYSKPYVNVTSLLK
jgi:hypothetical protein